MLMKLKQFQCFVSVLFQNVRTSEIKREIKLLFQFYFAICDDGLFTKHYRSSATTCTTVELVCSRLSLNEIQ